MDFTTIENEKKFKEILHSANKYRYIYSYNLSDEEFHIKDKVLRKIYITNSKGQKVLAIKYSFGFGDKAKYYSYNNFNDYKGMYANCDENMIIVFGSMMFLFMTEPIVENITLKDGTFDMDIVSPKRAVYDKMNGYIHSALYDFKNEFFLEFKPSKNVKKLNTFEELQEFLPRLKDYKLISVFTDLPNKKVGWLNTEYKGYAFEEEHSYSNGMKPLLFFNDTSYEGADKKPIGNWNTCNLYLIPEEFSKYNAFTFRSIFNEEAEEDFYILYMANTLCVFHNSRIIETEVRKVKSNVEFEFMYDTGIYTIVNNGEPTIVLPEISLPISEGNEPMLEDGPIMVVEGSTTFVDYKGTTYEIIDVKENGEITIQGKNPDDTLIIHFDEAEKIYIVGYPYNSIVFFEYESFEELLSMWK